MGPYTTIVDNPTMSDQLNCPLQPPRRSFVCSSPMVGSFKECLSLLRHVSEGEGEGNPHRIAVATPSWHSCALLRIVHNSSLIGYTDVA